jgi:hypothetical protein
MCSENVFDTAINRSGGHLPPPLRAVMSSRSQRGIVSCFDVIQALR